MTTPAIIETEKRTPDVFGVDAIYAHLVGTLSKDADLFSANIMTTSVTASDLQHYEVLKEQSIDPCLNCAGEDNTEVSTD